MPVSSDDKSRVRKKLAAPRPVCMYQDALHQLLRNNTNMRTLTKLLGFQCVTGLLMKACCLQEHGAAMSAVCFSQQGWMRSQTSCAVPHKQKQKNQDLSQTTQDGTPCSSSQDFRLCPSISLRLTPRGWSGRFASWLLMPVAMTL